MTTAKGFDRTTYLGQFRAEMEEHLQALGRGLLLLEDNPDDLSPVDDIFRRTHTVKGSARMMGFGDVAKLAHAMEDVLDDLKHGRVEPNPSLFNAMLTAVDLLRNLILSDPDAPDKRQDVQTVVRWIADVRGIQQEDDGTREANLEEIHQTPAHQKQEIANRETVRVDVDRIDTILNLAGELIVLDAARNQWMQEVTQLVETLDGPLSGDQLTGREKDSDRIRSVVEVLSKTTKRYRRMAQQQTELVRELHYQISVLRMLPVHAIFSLIPRAVRDIAKEEQKEVELTIEGEDTEIDREVLERVKDSVLHLVLNAVVHGIESPSDRIAAGKPPAGKVRVAAFGRGEQAIIEVEDDGAGIDFQTVRDVAVNKGIVTPTEADSLDESDCIRLLFLHGFSTSAIVSGRSGRGVGLDIVKAEIEGLKGHVSLRTKPGEGTKVILELPITLAFSHILLVDVGHETFGLACSSVQSIVDVTADQIRTFQGKECVVIGDRTVPLYWVDQILGINRPALEKNSRWPALLVGSIERPYALVVDRVIGDENVIVKPLGPLMRRVPYLSGGIILGDGRVVLMLSASALIDAARGTPTFNVIPSTKIARRAKRILVVDDVAITRELERNILEAAGYQVDTAVDGRDALAKLRSKEYELIVADVEMPNMDGLEMAAAVRADPSLNRLPIVIVSSRDSDEDKRRGMQVGVQAYVEKGSFDQMTLLDTIESIIG